MKRDYAKAFFNDKIPKIHRISSELSRKVRVSKESLILRFGGQVSSRFKLKWVEEVKLYGKSVFDDCSIA